MRYKTAIFDLDGTLVDSISTIIHLLDVVLPEFGLRKITEEEFFRYFGRGVRGMAIACLQMMKGDDYDDAMATAISNRMEQYYLEHPVGETAPFPGITDLLDELEAMGVQKMILTNKVDAITQKAVAGIFKPGTFTVVQGIAPGMVTKPDPSELLKLIEKSATPKEQCIIIGDTHFDIEAANNAGIDSIGVLWGGVGEEALRASGATYIVNEAAQIADIIRGL